MKLGVTRDARYVLPRGKTRVKVSRHSVSSDLPPSDFLDRHFLSSPDYRTNIRGILILTDPSREPCNGYLSGMSNIKSSPGDSPRNFILA